MNSEKITTVCISTCNRPEELTTTLSGLISNLKKHSRTPRILLSDDSENSPYTARIKEIIESFRKDYSGMIEVMDRNDRKNMAEEISKEKGIELEPLLFGLCGDKTSATTLGSSQNSLFLKTRGEKMIFVDDDVLYKFFCPAKEGVPSFELSNPNNFIPMIEGDAFPQDFKPAEIDLLAIHEQVLGQTISTVLGDNTPPYSLECQVIDSFMGSYGDSPMESHLPLLYLPQVYNNLQGVTFDRYQAMKETRRIIQSVPALTAYQGIICISMVMGVDNRKFVPPFMPNGRSQDLIFGTMRWKAFPLHITTYLPMLIGHERPVKESRGVSYNSVREMTKMNRFFASLILDVTNIEIDPVVNLQNIGNHLINITNVSDDEFINFSNERCTQLCKNLAQSLDHTITTTPGAPDFWVNDLQKISEELWTPNPELFLYDITKAPETNHQSTLKTWIHTYGRLLQDWGKLF